MKKEERILEIFKQVYLEGIEEDLNKIRYTISFWNWSLDQVKTLEEIFPWIETLKKINKGVSEHLSELSSKIINLSKIELFERGLDPKKAMGLGFGDYAGKAESVYSEMSGQFKNIFSRNSLPAYNVDVEIYNKYFTAPVVASATIWGIFMDSEASQKINDPWLRTNFGQNGTYQSMFYQEIEEEKKTFSS